MVCEHEYMNISPPNYRAGYSPGHGSLLVKTSNQMQIEVVQSFERNDGISLLWRLLRAV